MFKIKIQFSLFLILIPHVIHGMRRLVVQQAARSRLSVVIPRSPFPTRILYSTATTTKNQTSNATMSAGQETTVQYSSIMRAQHNNPEKIKENSIWADVYGKDSAARTDSNPNMLDKCDEPLLVFAARKGYTQQAGYFHYLHFT
jgi:hypothetical protein